MLQKWPVIKFGPNFETKERQRPNKTRQKAGRENYERGEKKEIKRARQQRMFFSLNYFLFQPNSVRETMQNSYTVASREFLDNRENEFLPRASLGGNNNKQKGHTQMSVKFQIFHSYLDCLCSYFVVPYSTE